MAKCWSSILRTMPQQIPRQSLPIGLLQQHNASTVGKEKPLALRLFYRGFTRAHNAAALVRDQPGPQSTGSSRPAPLHPRQTRAIIEAEKKQRQATRKERVTAVVEALSSERKLFDLEGNPLLSSITLRDACRCSRCVDFSTQQRNFSFVDIPVDVRAVLEGTGDDSSFLIKWKNDISGFSDHVSSFSLNELLDLAQCASTVSLPGKGNRVAWDRESICKKLVTMSFEAYMGEDKHLLTVIDALLRDGLVFIKGVPSDTDAISKLVERIGPLRNSFYGLTWDVRSKPKADNVAYTNKELGFHMDLLYMDHPPTFQFLHCVQNTCTGGESRFVDTIRARDIMFADHHDQNQVLEATSIKYHYHNLGHAYESSWRVFNNGNAVFWSPPFVERFASAPATHSSAQRALSACKTFASILERQDLVYERKMEEGTCVIFQNTRVLHARKVFDTNSGHRWLRGAYLDMQPLKSTYNRLIRQTSGDN